MAGGFVGRYAVVDLSRGQSEIVAPGEAFYRKYLSGYGLGAAVIAKRQRPGVDPLSSESHLGLCSGLLTGTGALFSGRFMAVGKSPLTGGWGDANAGGFFSYALKRAGYDAVFFTGAAQRPSWVFISEKGIEVRDAASLWGKDTVETEEAIRAELGDKRVQVACIGMSGERRSLISGIVTDAGRVAARSGLGAVMGSKRLKAVAVSGRGKVAAANSDAVKLLSDSFLKEYKKEKTADKLTVRFMARISQIIARTGVSIPAQASTVREIYKRYGTSGLTVYSALTGDMPIKNWDGVGYLDYGLSSAARLSDESVVKNQKRRYACQSCPLGCGGIMNIQKGRYAGTEAHKPEYETLGAFGGLILHDHLDTVLEVNEMCNRAGIDTISTGACIAFATECFEKGLIDETATGGLRLGWGNSEAILRLTEMMIRREGIGDILADGVRRASERIGKGSAAFAVHAGGQELPMHDSRLDPGYAMAYQCEPTPGRHTISCFLYAQLFGVKRIFPDLTKRLRRAKGKAAKNVQLYKAATVFTQIMNGAGVCMFGPLTGPVPVIDYLNAVTGWDLDPEDYYAIGERILSLRKAFNAREGVRPADHRLHDRALGRPSLPKGPLKGVTVDMEGLESEFFQTMGWDPSTGAPTREKMRELGIEELFP
jgi:aldehyde:ferredoxin oxidoreductase